MNYELHKIIHDMPIINSPYSKSNNIAKDPEVLDSDR